MGPALVQTWSVAVKGERADIVDKNADEEEPRFELSSVCAKPERVWERFGTVWRLDALFPEVDQVAL